MSSSGDGSGGYFPGMFGAATPMPGLPIAGKDSAIGDPYEYGKFQNFLPDIKAEGRNDNATGLRPDMFIYKSPSGVVQQSSGDAQIQDLRNQLAALQAAQASQGGGGANMADLMAALQQMQRPIPEPSPGFGGGGDGGSAAA